LEVSTLSGCFSNHPMNLGAPGLDFETWETTNLRPQGPRKNSLFELLPVQMKSLNQLEGRARGDRLAQGRLFAGGQIGFQTGVGLGKAAANHHGHFEEAAPALR